MLFFFFFNDTATTEIYTLSLHDALPISSIVLLIAGVSSFFPSPTAPNRWTSKTGAGSGSFSEIERDAREQAAWLVMSPWAKHKQVTAETRKVVNQSFFSVFLGFLP